MERILVTGSGGLVGGAIKSVSMSYPQYEFIFINRGCDLINENQVKTLYSGHQPDYVIHAAARVGGIGGHSKHHAEFFYENVLMNSFMVHYAYKYKIKKFIGFSSVCAFPDSIPVLREELMHKGEPFAGNFAYGYAKRMLDVQIAAYGVKNYSSIIPCNIFGEADYYNLESGHVLPSLIHKLYLANKENQPLRVWGDGSSSREFIYAKDLATILMKIIDLETIPQRIIVSHNTQFTIKQIVDKLCEVTGFENGIIWETDKPNGQRARPTDLSLLRSLIGDFGYTDMAVALKNSYDWFAENYPKVRM